MAEPVEDARDREVVAKALPACDVVAVLHHGSYRDLDRPYRVLSRYIEDNDLATAGPPREIYLASSGETDPGAAVTEIVWPVVASSGAM